MSGVYVRLGKGGMSPFDVRIIFLKCMNCAIPAFSWCMNAIQTQTKLAYPSPVLVHLFFLYLCLSYLDNLTSFKYFVSYYFKRQLLNRNTVISAFWTLNCSKYQQTHLHKKKFGHYDQPSSSLATFKYNIPMIPLWSLLNNLF